MHVDLAKGEAVLEIHSLCSVFDIGKRRSFTNGATFRGDFVENSAAIELTVATPPTNPPFTPAAQNGFRFIADPKTTVTDFAQIGRENNGALF